MRFRHGRRLPVWTTFLVSATAAGCLPEVPGQLGSSSGSSSGEVSTGRGTTSPGATGGAAPAGAAGPTGGSGLAGGAGGSTANGSTGGNGGATSSGGGGGSTANGSTGGGGGAAGSGGAASSAGAGGSPFVCASDEKLCALGCVRLDDPATGCAAPTCAPCAFAHAGVVCALGVCALGACDAGFEDCDQDPANGCETSTSTLTDCGACSQSCALSNAIATCAAGTCSIGWCMPPFFDCDGFAFNGCEVDIENDAANCGGCVPGAGAICDDDVVCNGKETCSLGTCVPGADLVCDDGDACNGVETCDALLGCAAGAALDCDDGDACNGVETCDALLGCAAGTAVDCDDGVACTQDACDAVSGVCSHALDDTFCDDGLACDGFETCVGQAGAPGSGCSLGEPVACAGDGIACTNDVCTEPLGTCAYVPNAGACGVGEHCSPKGGCAPLVCSPDGWCWMDPLPQGNYLVDVVGTAADDVWAVGVAGTAIHWNGSFWSGATGIADRGFVGVWAGGPSGAWAVGPKGLVRHWDGSSWVSTGEDLTTMNLTGVWGSGPSDVWVTADGAMPGQWPAVAAGHIFRWNGSSWATEETGVETLLQTVGVTGIWGSSPNDIWAVATDAGALVVEATSYVLHWQGSAWTQVHGPVPHALWDVWAAGPNEAWFTGQQRSAGFGPLAIHWDGSEWTEPALGLAIGLQGSLSAVFGTGPDDAWAVSHGSLKLHWDGAAWLPMVDDKYASLSGVWQSAVDDAWAVGADGAIQHWDGTAWSKEVALVGSAVGTDVWGSGPGDVWVASWGKGMRHFDGSTWTIAQETSGAALRGVWGSAAADVWAVGPWQVWHFDGSAWTPSTGATNAAFHAVAGSDAANVWSVGKAGMTQRWDGEAWTVWPSGTTSDLNAVWTAGPNEAWAVGEAGTILHWNGATWSPSPSGATENLEGVWGSGPNDVWAVGHGASILHYDGNAWAFVAVDAGYYLWDVWGTGPNDVWVTGGETLHWNGSTWTKNVTGEYGSSYLHVWSCAEEAWVVGSGALRRLL